MLPLIHHADQLKEKGYRQPFIDAARHQAVPFGVTTVVAHATREAAPIFFIMLARQTLTVISLNPSFEAICLLN
jgi:hypothetical protein